MNRLIAAQLPITAEEDLRQRVEFPTGAC